MFLRLWKEKQAKAGVNRFYERQNNLMEGCKSDEEWLQKEDSDREADGEKDQRTKVWDTRLAVITVVLNVILIAAKIVAVMMSHSIAIVASVVDSAMDITSGLVIWYTCRAIEKTNKRLYPVGLDRLEPLTVLVVGMIMIFANLIVVEQAIMDSATGHLNPQIDIATLVILCTGTVIKIGLFLVCRVRSSAASKCLAIDQRNDVLTNMVALAGAYIGSQWWKYADPIGALLVSGFIIITWLSTVGEQVPLLVGRVADPEYINRITNISIGHDSRIQCIDTIHMYHFGANFLVEVHVVMDSNVCLTDSHDVSESLQVKLERLPFVQRAFVHTDYKLDGDEHV